MATAAATGAAALWQPQEEGLREICAVLEAHISPNSDQARIWQQLQHYAQFPDFNNYLVFLLARGQIVAAVVFRCDMILLLGTIGVALLLVFFSNGSHKVLHKHCSFMH